MRVSWRFGLVAIVAAAVVGGFLPHGVLTGAESTATQMVQVAESPLSVPGSCTDATCGKGAPAPAAPTPVVALAAVLAGIAAAAVAASALRRRHARVTPLPTGSRDRLFHPPKFS
jgi:hypothetical protein